MYCKTEVAKYIHVASIIIIVTSSEILQNSTVTAVQGKYIA